ncbi:MAG TPA: hypothetical protein PKO21_15455 [Verrucomicrobiota bacterium]|nr:hypothetical protein [Verrucomicrobiota bacterium]
MSGEPFFDFRIRLLHERPHGQAINESARPGFTLEVEAIPQPRQYHGSGFTETSGDIDELRLAGRAILQSLRFASISLRAAGQPTLVTVGSVGMVRGLMKKFSVHHVIPAGWEL